MDSTRPPSISPAGASPRSLRPWYLVAAMVMTWFLGVQSMSAGCTTLRQVRDGGAVEVAAATEAAQKDDPHQLILIVYDAARTKAAIEMRQITFPLGVAKLLLAGLLVIASGLAMAGRPGARSLALQALVANVALSIVAYVLTRDVRAHWIDAVARAGATLPQVEPREAQLLDPRFIWWLERTRLVVLDIGAMLLAAIALTSRRSASFFAAVAAAGDSSEDR
jgi:hypothetical protein